MLSRLNGFPKSIKNNFKVQSIIRCNSIKNHNLKNTHIQYIPPKNIDNIKEYKDFLPQPISVIKNEKNIEIKHYAINDSNDSKLLPLKLASHLYATVNIYTRPFTVQKGDLIVLPSQLKGLKVGDEINFHDVTVIGSTNYKIVDHPINPDIFEIKGRVVEKSKSAEFYEDRTTKRNRKVKHIVKTVNMTMIEITELKLK
ncbi:hypothetical protein ACO0R3_002204 [Hanseniaspora guilliermondii]